MLKAVLPGEKEITLLADSKTTVANCEAYAKNAGCVVHTIEEDDGYHLHITVNK